MSSGWGRGSGRGRVRGRVSAAEPVAVDSEVEQGGQAAYLVAEAGEA